MSPYKIYVLRYAWRDAPASHILLGDLHGEPIPMSYYVWVVTNGEDTVVVDLGFTEPLCRRRGRNWLHEPAALMDSVGIDPAKVRHVVVSHMHWDHAGNYDLFPNATFYVQEDEMAFWTGPYLKYPVFRQALEVEDLLTLVRLNYDGRVAFINGSAEILPGISLHKASGHTRGMQITEVPTASGTAVVASDAVHSYENLRRDLPTVFVHNVPGYLEGYAMIRRLAKDEQHILPGHDSEVMKILPQVQEDVAVLE